MTEEIFKTSSWADKFKRFTWQLLHRWVDLLLTPLKASGRKEKTTQIDLK